MNTIAPTMSRSAAVPYQRRKDSPAIKKLKQEQRDAIMKDSRFRALGRGERNLMRQLMWWHDPLTGQLGSRTTNATLAERLDVTVRSVALSRHGLLAVGLIVGYLPGNGHKAGTYVIARSWDEADEAVALRVAQGDEAPWFPEIPDRSVPSVPKPRSADGENEGQDVTEEMPTQPDSLEPSRLRKRRQRTTEPTPGPPPAAELQSLAEVQERLAEPDQFEQARIRGAALARAELSRLRPETGAA